MDYSNPEQRKKHIARTIAWRNANRDKWNEIRRRSAEKNREKNAEKHRIRNREYAKNHYAERLVYTKRYLSDPKNRKRRAQTILAWNLRRREKLVGNARPHFCPICKRTGKMVVDHCHKTGKIRGWICDSCNVALGRVADSISTLNALIKHLKR